MMLSVSFTVKLPDVECPETAFLRSRPEYACSIIGFSYDKQENIQLSIPLPVITKHIHAM